MANSISTVSGSVSFIVFGNQEDENEGNPIPYTRTTQASKWSPRYMRYTAWKTYVVAQYLDTVFPNKQIRREDMGEIHDLLEKKPIKKGVRARVVAHIFFGKENHSDPDNIVKGINDALFMDDKHVDVQTHHSCGNKKPRIEVTITFNMDL